MTSLDHILTGRTEDHLASLDEKIKIHKDVLNPFKEMQKEAFSAGFDLQICSGFRGFGSQLGIWNAKAKGERPVLDDKGKPVAITKMKPKEIVYAILRWSALPGASRHHWGTDFDIFDKKTLTKDYKIQLVPEEYEATGIFGGISSWLDENMERFGFFRPYAIDLGGVSPERWHISYAPLAEEYLEGLDEKLLMEVIEESAVELKDTVKKELSNIYRKYVRNISIMGKE